MKIVVSTHNGNVCDEEIDYVVVHSDDDGEYAVLKDHVPVVSVMDSGFLKLVSGKDEKFISIISGIFEFSNNSANVLVQEAYVGDSVETAKNKLEEIRKARLEKERKETSDFTKMERELQENLRNSKAGQL